MKTIEERALEWSQTRSYNKHNQVITYEEYVKGATDQQEIDIERAWKHIEDWFEEDEKRVAKLALTKTIKGE